MQQCLSLALDLRGVHDERSRSHPEEVKPAPRKRQRGVSRQAGKQLRTSFGDYASTAAAAVGPGAGSLLACAALYFANLCYPDHVVACLPRWVEVQLHGQNHTGTCGYGGADKCGQLPSVWIDSAAKRLAVLTGTPQKKKKNGGAGRDTHAEAGARRSARQIRPTEAALSALADQSMGEEDAPRNQPVASKTTSGGGAAAPITLAGILTRDVEVLFQLLVMGQQRRAEEREEERPALTQQDVRLHSSSKHRSFFNLTYVRFRRRCALDEAVANALGLLAEHVAEDQKQVGQGSSDVTALGLLLRRASDFLCRVAELHPSLWLARYQDLVLRVVTSTRSAGPSHCLSPLLQCLLNSYQGCLTRNPLAVHVASSAGHGRGEAQRATGVLEILAEKRQLWLQVMRKFGNLA